ncbi:MAG: phosphoenolpyruvate-protein phosphotransferase [Gammaproteobacteria bacterium]|nr:phosphoenolpyruvate-protein phosphotransferase [Gammaproteobacteria bacterium]NIR98853.1 phosphoenolpyruvate-protein phosphotransferase [Gammaproteobacteria bacterium]NIT63974.1 phosphoenolpyruvate-protein phosphotransferase [Gammaproteobacteria bacterium]NIV19134.1 phosphoenolpyruvate-protein phosphotransferase [Gammaproteobacteria bacterium]NIX10303.1 phosphoenolpyruvate-protein phosphotransferase [Gammaproteobacteria bacterium]
MLKIQAAPFAPGRARGVLRRGLGALAPDSVLVVEQGELGGLAERACRRPRGIAALVVIGAAPLSHPMIRLLGLGVPVVIAGPAQARELPEGMEVVLDGAGGTISDPRGTPPAPPEPAPPAAGMAPRTVDGQVVELRASIADAAGAEEARRLGATGIGLVRSEYLCPPDGRQPDADFFERALAAVCGAVAPLPVTVRLPDVAADKRPPWCASLKGMEGPLALQGARLFGAEPVRSVWRAVVEAVMRLAPRYEMALLLPYVTRTDEYLRWRCEVEAVLPVPLAVGAMAESPAAVLAALDWLKVADFVAVGCNDLMQCLFAADRDIPEVAYLLDPYAPVLFRFLRRLAESAGEEAGRLQLCGLLPQLPGVLSLLLGLGFRTFSVEPRLIPQLAGTVAATDTAAAQARAVGVCALSTPQEVRALLGVPEGAAWGLGAGRVSPAGESMTAPTREARWPCP